MAKPNVIFVITDDQGYKDIGAHGHPYIITPNLDALHAQSVRATEYHVRPTCSPTRAAIMSGRNPMRSGIWHTIMGRSMMNGDEVTLAETLKAGGYVTGMFGKWHLGDNAPMRPQDQGFDVVVQHKGGGITQGPDYYGNDYFDDHYLRNGVAEPFDGFCTDIWFDEAMKFIEENQDKPFFAYVATNAPHHPWNVDPQYEKPYLEMGVAKSASPYYALITNIDENMGRLMKRLKELNLEEDTLLIFTTDNGPAGGWPLKGDTHSKPLPNFTAGMKGAKGACYEGGHRVPLFLRWPAGGLGGAEGRDFDTLMADIDILPTLADFCGVTKPDGPPIDGISFAGALLGKTTGTGEGRYLAIQTQRYPLPKEEARTVVLHDNWRLVLNHQKPGIVELYDVKADRSQSENLVEKYPERVKAMQAAYHEWYTSQEAAFSDYSRISIGSDAEPVTRLMSHDWLTETIQECVWHQNGVTSGQMGNGPWAVHIDKPGTYEFALRRWPTEHPGPIEADHAKIQVGDQVAEAKVDPAAQSAPLRLQLPEGPAMLQTWLHLPGKDQTRGAYYVYARRVGE